MQDKQKVTLYLPPDLHRQLKVHAAMETMPMSAIAEQAIEFYLAHPAIVDEVVAHGHNSHRVYNCPDCSSAVVLKDGEMVALGTEPTVLSADNELPIREFEDSRSQLNKQGEELVPC